MNIKYKFGTQAEYDRLPFKDKKTIYIITDTKNVYIGNQKYNNNSDGTSPSIPADLSNYVTFNDLQQAINNIQIPEVDLSNLLPVITPISSENNNKIAMIINDGANLSPLYTLQQLAEYLISTFNLLTKKQVNILTKEEYNGLTTISPTTIYIISDTQEIFMGTKIYSSGSVKTIDENGSLTNDSSDVNGLQVNATIASPVVVTVTSS